MKMLSVILVICLSLNILAEAQDGFISIDCGATSGYVDENLTITYTTDVGFVESGQAGLIDQVYFSQVPRQLHDIWIFPDSSTRNCYTLRPEQGKNNRYLIRASFLYGDYDSKSQAPMFDLYIDVNYWITVYPTEYTYEEIIYYASRDYIQVCLVNLGYGTPFISALELRLLDNSTYINAVPGGALRQRWRLNVGSNNWYRYPQDDFDRLWEGRIFGWDLINTTDVSDANLIKGNNNPYKVPAEVLMTAEESIFGLAIYWTSDPLDQWYIYFHFTEFQVLQTGQVMELNVYVEDSLLTTVTPEYLKPVTVSSLPVSAATVNFSINSSDISQFPPFINAVEIFLLLDLPSSMTDLNDVNAIVDIKKTYGLIRDTWQGDPCVPKNFSWSGLNCSQGNSPRILYLNLTSSRLRGSVADSFQNLTALVSLDLSLNELTGPIPEFFAEMPNLKVLNLSRNNFSGSIPEALKKKNGTTFLLRVDENPFLCQSDSCAPNPTPTPNPNPNPTPTPNPSPGRKKNSIFIPVIAAAAAFVWLLILLCIVAIIVSTRARKRRAQAQEVNAVRAVEITGTTEDARSRESAGTLHSGGDISTEKSRPFTSFEIIRITEYFKFDIGEGGFGKVYLGSLDDGAKVAIKLLSKASRQGYKEFQAEAQLLMIVNHRNLVKLIGYCDEAESMALIYEFMSGGNLRQHLSENSATVLTWYQRLHIAIDAAQGLDYLHNGCRPPIVHRDLKTSNILLDENMQARISDFGLSRAFPADNVSHVMTRHPAGTPGYLGPVFHSSGNVNKKSDIYSFGVILLELISGQPAIVRNPTGSSHIVQWVSPLIEGGDLHGIVDPRMHGQFSETSVWKVIEIAMKCVQLVPMRRPDTSRILLDLKECLALEDDRRQGQLVEDSEISTSTTFEVTSVEMNTAPSAR